MKFGRRKSDDAAAETPDATAAEAEADESGESPQADDAAGAQPGKGGPHDIDDVDVEGDGVERVDLGGMLITPQKGMELRLQVDEASGAVQSVLLAAPDGAVEVRAFAAARNGDLWSDVRSSISAETARAGGSATEREGRFGTELACQMQVVAPDGRSAIQPSRVIGVNGPRWFLRATFLGKPAVEPEAAGPWEDAVAGVVVRRGTGAMAPGDPLPVTLPESARRVR